MRVMSRRSGVEKPSAAITTLAAIHSTENSSPSRRRRTSSRTNTARPTAARATMIWVREMNSTGAFLGCGSNGALDPRHERGQQVLVGVVDRLAEGVEGAAGRPLAHGDRHLAQPEAAPRQRNEERGIREVLGKVALAHLHHLHGVGAKPRGGI